MSIKRKFRKTFHREIPEDFEGRRFIETKEVELPGISFWSPFRRIASLVGIFTMIVGLVISLTLILFVPGFLLIFVGYSWYEGLGKPKQVVSCNYCHNEQKAVAKSKRLECVYCKSITPLKWVKRNRRSK